MRSFWRYTNHNCPLSEYLLLMEGWVCFFYRAERMMKDLSALCQKTATERGPVSVTGTTTTTSTTNTPNSGNHTKLFSFSARKAVINNTRINHPSTTRVCDRIKKLPALDSPSEYLSTPNMCKITKQNKRGSSTKTSPHREQEHENETMISPITEVGMVYGRPGARIPLKDLAQVVKDRTYTIPAGVLKCNYNVRVLEPGKANRE